MLKKYTHEELRKLYKELPDELQDAIWSKETADNIYNICKRNNLKENSIVAKLVGKVLLGVLPLKEFQETVGQELSLDEKTVKEVTREINQFIFYPVRIHLEKLYQTETTPYTTPPPSATKIKTEPKELQKEKIEEGEEDKGNKEKEKRIDKYRESIE
jgi:hypothetical protein